ncbi:MAG: Rpn family recombination-promoting nuclease/putative transposase, partial [Planctomycetaceae bacterium]|nr:Rpn family recombination-promoting nuclease/putative transposase [Planctomycetaceae bacterium]
MSEDQSKQQQLLEQPFDETALSKFRKEFRHDEFGRNKLKEVRTARKFLIHVLKPEVKALLDIDKLEIDSESFVDDWLKSFYLDVLYRIPLKNSNEYLVIFILIELKTDNDQFTIFQILRYIINVWWRE